MSAEQVVPKSLAARVRAGVAFLDENMPCWPDRVTVEELNMADGCYCVLGQVYGDFYRAERDLFNEDCGMTAIRLGFDARGGKGPGVVRREFYGLARLWSFVIRQRQAVAK